MVRAWRYLFLIAVVASCQAQESAPTEAHLRVSCSAGIGVLYLSARDVVDLVNSTASPFERVPQFRAVADFFASVALPIADDLLIKAEYAYLSGSYAVPSAFGQAEYSIAVHAPSLILQYVLLDRGVYDLKIGAGGGIHFGTLTTTLVGQSNSYSANGPGFVAELEANTAFGDNLFAYLGGAVRWDLIGELQSATGGRPLATGTPVTLHFFGVSARLGLTYYF